MRLKQALLLATLVPVLVSVVVVLGACGEGDTETTVVEAQTTAATIRETTTATQETTTTTSAAPTTTTAAWSRPLTTELPPGGTRLENGHVQVVGYVTSAAAIGPQLIVHFVPAELLTAEEAASLAEIHPAGLDPREVSYEISSAVSITVSTLGDGGEQAMTVDQFVSIWSPSPPEGGEHLADVLWRIEYGEDSIVVSITEEGP